MIIDTYTIIAAAIGLVVGLLLGLLLFSGGKKRAELSARLAERKAELSAAGERIDSLERELAMARDQIAPLADEVDKLRAMKTRTPAPEVETAAPAVSDSAAEASAQPLPAFLDEKPAEPDDLSKLKGVGPMLEAMLHGLGVWYFAQIANWTDEETAMVDSKLGTFRGRIARDQLQEQAKLLAAGRITEYEARYGKLGGGAS